MMKLVTLLTFSASVLAAGCLSAQTSPIPVIEPVAGPAKPRMPATVTFAPSLAVIEPVVGPGETRVAEIPPAALPPAIPAPPAAETSGPASVPGTPATIVPGPPAVAIPGTPEQPKQEMQKSEEGFILKDAPLNDIFQFLAKSAGRQYFHNTKIAGADFLVTGHLNEGNPLEQMEELAFMYGLSLHTKGSTIYALTQVQLNQLPSIEFHYQLRYLRPTNIEQIKELIKPMLSPGTGIVNFEPKTNTIIIIDSAHRIEQARALLHGIDQAKGQIVVETKILRVNSSTAERTGVNWSTSLGKTGTDLSLTTDLNAILGLKSPIVTTTSNRIATLPSTSTIVGSEIKNIVGTGADILKTGSTSTTTSNTTSNSGGITGGSTRNSSLTNGPNLVLSPVQLSGVLRALAEGNLANQISNPTLITEDNEQATISIIDRVPIITTTSTQGSGASANPTVTEQVRYKIDMSDKSIDTDPEKHREIGISIVVTPTLLPDGTVRMKLRPRSAQIIEQIKSITGNFYPRVTESMVESIARVPDGFSLVVGGFYGEATSSGKTKIPLLGDIPVLNFFFKSKEATKEKTSLVFIVTPKSYDPTNRGANNKVSSQIRANTAFDCDHDWVDPENPGPAHEPNMQRSLRGLQPTQAPYYPRGNATPKSRFGGLGGN